MTELEKWDEEFRKEGVAISITAMLILAALAFVAILAGLRLAAWMSDAEAKSVTLFGYSMLPAIAVCLVGGTLGGSLSALLSAADRWANGLESWAGKKFPGPRPKDKFSLRMAPFFLIRPVLGGALGVVVYAGIRSGLLFAQKNGTDDAQLNMHALAFYATLAGLFAKTLLERLKDMFKAFVGKDEKEKGSSSSEPNNPSPPKDVLR
jgi:hypothetical protein